MCVYLRAKFEVSSIILTSFRQARLFYSPPSKRTPKKPTQIRVNPSLLEGVHKMTLSQNTVSRMAWNFRLSFSSCRQNFLRNILSDRSLKSVVSMWNTTLRWNTENNTFFSHHYLLKCIQHMPDVFSTENLSIHYKILIGLKDQFDLHKLLQFFYENKTCTLRLIYLMILFGKGWRNSYFKKNIL